MKPILHTPLPLTLCRAQALCDYVPRVEESGWEIWHTQAYWVLEADEVEQLQCQVRVGNRVRAAFPFRPGTWHLYAPGTGYRIRYPLPLRAHRNLWVMFDLTGPLPGLRRRAVSVFGDEAGLLAEHVQRLDRLQAASAPGDPLQAAGVLLHLAGLLINAAQGPGRGTPEQPWLVQDPTPGLPTDTDSLLARVDEALSRQLHTPPTVAELSRQLGLSASSLAHRLQAETGWTVVSRIRHLRVAEAQRRLAANPTVPLKALASSLGFSSPQYLIRVFRQVTGMTPRQFEATSAYRRGRMLPPR